MKTKKLIPIVLSLGIGVVTLTSCSSSNRDTFYDDASNIIGIIRIDLANGQSYSNSQLDEIDQFINKYSNLKMDDPKFSDYVKTIGEVEDYSKSKNN